MKATLLKAWFGFVLIQMPIITLTAGTAQVQMYNHSLLINPGNCSCGFGGLTWTTSFSSFYTEDPWQANGEVAPLGPPAAYSHRTYLVMLDPSLYASTTFAQLDLPLADADGNGVPDFFEPAQELSATTGGKYGVVWSPGYGLLTLQWSRAAGATQGSLQLRMNDPILGQLGPYNHTFELVRYTGDLTYARNADGVTGNIHLVMDGGTGAVLEGPIQLSRSGTNRVNQVLLSGGDWTNQLEVFTFGSMELVRDAAANVYRGNLQDSGSAYQSWALSITDTNDANHNGIPDLSDDLGVPPPRRPALGLSRIPDHLVLTVSGEVGRMHSVQQSTNLSSTNWQTLQSLSLTNDPQSVVLPLPAQSPTFWRVLAE